MEATLSSGLEYIAVLGHANGALPAIEAFLAAVDGKQIESPFHPTRIVAIIA